MHPHFLFNSLNNLYLLTLEHRPEAPEVVLKLSEMLDYMLYHCNEPLVQLSKEIELLQNYIDLEKLRYDKNADIKLVAHIEDANILIAPLLPLSLVENAFKHGGNNQAGSFRILVEVERSAHNFKNEGSKY